MRKRKFVAVGIIGGIICFACFVFGRKKGYMKGYRDADNMIKNESVKSV